MLPLAKSLVTYKTILKKTVCAAKRTLRPTEKLLSDRVSDCAELPSASCRYPGVFVAGAAGAAGAAVASFCGAAAGGCASSAGALIGAIVCRVCVVSVVVVLSLV